MELFEDDETNVSQNAVNFAVSVLRVPLQLKHGLLNGELVIFFKLVETSVHKIRCFFEGNLRRRPLLLLILYTEKRLSFCALFSILATAQLLGVQRHRVFNILFEVCLGDRVFGKGQMVELGQKLRSFFLATGDKGVVDF